MFYLSHYNITDVLELITPVKFFPTNNRIPPPKDLGFIFFYLASAMLTAVLGLMLHIWAPLSPFTAA